MYKNLGYAKYENIIWNIVNDNQDGTVDLSIDDIQGDICICYVNKDNIILVEKEEYDKKILELKNKKP